MKIGFVRLGAALVFGGALLACAGDVADEDAGSGGASAGNGSGTTSSNTSNNGATSGASGGETCGPSSIDANNPCEVCVATSCTSLALACCNQPGCLDIISCAQSTGCEGINCYSPDTCQEVIDAAGGPEIAINYAQPLGDCAAENCAMECELDAGG